MTFLGRSRSFAARRKYFLAFNHFQGEMANDRIRHTCGGRSVWVATRNVASLERSLDASRWRGVIVRGAGAGMRIGAVERNIFEERVRRVLDPQKRFRAASDPA